MARPKTRKDDERGFHIRLPNETWKFLKMSSIIREMTMAEIVIESVEKQRKSIKKKYSEIGDFEEQLNEKNEE